VSYRERADPPPLEIRQRVAEARLVAAALVAYCLDHGEVLPTSLEDLRPAYIGTNVALDKFMLRLPGARLKGDYDNRAVAIRLPVDGRCEYVLGDGTVSRGFVD
jgi:hypothetical protein